MMKKVFLLCMALTISASPYDVIIAAGQPTSSEMEMKQQSKKEPLTGEELFMKHCSICHPEGGNIINPDKPLHKDALGKSGISTMEDVIKLMRNPGKGMRAFDTNTLPDKDAEKIAEYILKTF